MDDLKVNFLDLHRTSFVCYKFEEKLLWNVEIPIGISVA